MERAYFLLTRVVQNRLVLFGCLLAIQSLFFVTNGINSLLRPADAGWELKIPAIDNHLTPQGIWLIPYAVGFVLSAALPLWAAFHMPTRLYRQFLFSMGLAALASYVIYLIFPTYVVKPAPEAVSGSDIFSRTLRTIYKVDNSVSTHNAAPSQHVFYAVLNMCFMIRFRSRPLAFWVWTSLATLISASALLTRQHHSPDLIAGYAMAVIMYPVGLAVGGRITDRLGDADSPPLEAPLLQWTRAVSSIKRARLGHRPMPRRSPPPTT